MALEFQLKLSAQSFISFQFSSVAKSCLTPRDPMDCSMPGFPVPVLHHLLEFAQCSCALSLWYHPAISSTVIPFSSSLRSFPAWVFSNELFFASGPYYVKKVAGIWCMCVCVCVCVCGGGGQRTKLESPISHSSVYTLIFNSKTFI